MYKLDYSYEDKYSNLCSMVCEKCTADITGVINYRK